MSFAHHPRQSGSGTCAIPACLLPPSESKLAPQTSPKLSLPSLTWFAWLERELQSPDRPVVISSHHPSFTLTNDYSPAGPAPRVLRDQVLDLLLDADQVVLWLAVHILRAKHDFGSQVVVVSTVVDHQAPAMPHMMDLRNHRNLASVSRLLSANDYHQYGVPKAELAGGALNAWWSVPTR